MLNLRTCAFIILTCAFFSFLFFISGPTFHFEVVAVYMCGFALQKEKDLERTEPEASGDIRIVNVNIVSG